MIGWRIERSIREAFSRVGEYAGDILLIGVLVLVASAAFYLVAAKPQGTALLTDIARVANDLTASGRMRADPFIEGVDNIYIYANGTRICVRPHASDNETTVNVPLLLTGESINISLPRIEGGDVCKEIPGLVSLEGGGPYDGLVRVEVFKSGSGIVVRISEAKAGGG